MQRGLGNSRVRTLPTTKWQLEPTAAPQQRFNARSVALGLAPCESSVFPESVPHRQVGISTQQPRGTSTQVLATEGSDGQTAALSELEEEIFRQVTVTAHASMAASVPEPTSTA